MTRANKVIRYLQAPEGLEVSEPVEWNDIDNLRLTALSMVDKEDPVYEAFKGAIGKVKLKTLRTFFINNGYTFVKRKDLKEISNE